MIIRVRVEVQAEPNDGMYGSYGSLSFNEETSLTGADFPIISKVFSDMHTLLEHVKFQHTKERNKCNEKSSSS
jgi:hypothetical protein